jgi:hypothetical protein
VLQKHGIRLIELDYTMFRYDSRRRLRRDRETDLVVVAVALRNRLDQAIPASR